MTAAEGPRVQNAQRATPALKQSKAPLPPVSLVVPVPITQTDLFVKYVMLCVPAARRQAQLPVLPAQVAS